MSVDIKEFDQLDPRLDWVSMHDSQSENYPIRANLQSIERIPVAYRTGPVLDQGNEGACVGFGWTAELIASPRPFYNVTPLRANQYAKELYRRAQKIDEWEGENYSGTSVLAGAKVAKERGLIDEYRWCFGINDVRDAVISEGPVVIGIPWYSGMYETRPSGLVQVNGDLVGGHCILLTGYHPGMRIYGEDWDRRYEVFRWRNSWGEGYGKKGNGTILLSDLRDLLTEWGEACVPMGRKLVRF